MLLISWVVTLGVQFVRLGHLLHLMHGEQHFGPIFISAYDCMHNCYLWHEMTSLPNALPKKTMSKLHFLLRFEKSIYLGSVCNSLMFRKYRPTDLCYLLFSNRQLSLSSDGSLSCIILKQTHDYSTWRRNNQQIGTICLRQKLNSDKKRVPRRRW